MPTDKTLKLPSYGGQALMEGVMMRGKNHAAMAVRAPNGEIVTYQEAARSLSLQMDDHSFVRGIFNLWDARAGHALDQIRQYSIRRRPEN